MSSNIPVFSDKLSRRIGTVSAPARIDLRLDDHLETQNWPTAKVRP